MQFVISLTVLIKFSSKVAMEMALNLYLVLIHFFFIKCILLKHFTAYSLYLRLVIQV